MVASRSFYVNSVGLVSFITLDKLKESRGEEPEGLSLLPSSPSFTRKLRAIQPIKSAFNTTERLLGGVRAGPWRLAPPARSQRRAQFLQQSFIADDQEGLCRRLQQVEDFAAVRARVDLAAVRQESDPAAAARRLE